MLTGTPLDMTPFGPILTGLGWLYWALAASALWFALRGKKRWPIKAVGALVVLVVFGTMPGYELWKGYQTSHRLRVAETLFAERCKTAGGRMIRTIQGVDGIVWMKWRPKETNFSDQFKLDDPYGRGCGGEACILELLRVTKDAGLNPAEAREHSRGYAFVETIDPIDRMRYRYVGVMKPAPSWTPEAIEKANKAGKPLEPYNYRFSLERQRIDEFTARYGITWDDLSTREDREYWIAGGSLEVIDLPSGDVIARHVGYMVDQGLGSTAEYRSPWAAAPRTACPAFPKTPLGAPFLSYRNRDFIFRVLAPKAEGN